MKITWYDSVFKEKLKQKEKNILEGYGKRIVLHIKQGMKSTPRRTSHPIMYKGKEHYPSLPDNYPANMSGQLSEAMTSETKIRANDVAMRYGVFKNWDGMDGIGYAYYLNLDIRTGRRKYLDYALAETKNEVFNKVGIGV